MLSSFFLVKCEWRKKNWKSFVKIWWLDISIEPILKADIPLCVYVCGTYIAYIRSIKSLSDNYSKVAKCFIQYFQWKTKFWSLNQVTIAINRLIFASIYSFWFAYQILYYANKFIHTKLVFTWLYDKMALIAVNNECCNANTFHKYQFFQWNTMSCARIRFTTDLPPDLASKKNELHICGWTLSCSSGIRMAKRTDWHSIN